MSNVKVMGKCENSVIVESQRAVSEVNQIVLGKCQKKLWLCCAEGLISVTRHFATIHFCNYLWFSSYLGFLDRFILDQSKGTHISPSHLCECHCRRRSPCHSMMIQDRSQATLCLVVDGVQTHGYSSNIRSSPSSLNMYKIKSLLLSSAQTLYVKPLFFRHNTYFYPAQIHGFIQSSIWVTNVKV